MPGKCNYFCMAVKSWWTRGPNLRHDTDTMTTRPTDHYSNRKHKWYADEEIADAVDALAAANKKHGKKLQSRSALLTRGAILLLRKPENIKRLRSEGYRIPAGVLTK